MHDDKSNVHDNYLWRQLVVCVQVVHYAHASIHNFLDGNGFGLLIMCWSHDKFIQLIYILYFISVLFYLAPGVPKICYCVKSHSLLSIIIILWIFDGVFHPHCFEVFSWGASCVIFECLMWWNGSLIQVLCISASKIIKDQRSTYLHKI